jgi:hypothetical protein
MVDQSKIFEIASRNKFRFSYKGLITVEDLWDLNVRELDDIFRTLNAILRSEKESESLIAPKSISNDLETKVEIIRYIVATKISEAEESEHLLEIKQKKQKIMDLIEKKKEDGLESKTEEELYEMLNNM